jgi:hypothetical protein
MVGGNRPGLTDQTASRRWLIRLGASEGAIRKRVARGTLRSKLGADGKRYVYLNGGGDEGADASSIRESEALRSERDALIECKGQDHRYPREPARRGARGQRGAAEDNRRAHPTHPGARGPVFTKESGASERVAEEPERAQPRSASGEAQEPSEQRPALVVAEDVRGIVLLPRLLLAFFIALTVLLLILGVLLLPAR